MLKIVPHFDYELQKGCAFCLMYDCKLQHENKIMLQCGECFSIELGHYTGLVNRLLGLSDFSCIVQYFIVGKKQLHSSLIEKKIMFVSLDRPIPIVH